MPASPNADIFGLTRDFRFILIRPSQDLHELALTTHYAAALASPNLQYIHDYSVPSA